MRLEKRLGVREPVVLGYAPNLIEAYLRLGRRLEAAELLARFEAEAAHSSSRNWAQATAARCRGLLAPDGNSTGILKRLLVARSTSWSARTSTDRTLLGGTSPPSQ